MIDGKFSDPRGGTAVGVRITAGADQSQIVGRNDDGTLSVRLTCDHAGSPAANDELIALLASRLGVARDKIDIVAGHNQPDKILTIEGITTEDAEAKLGLG